MTLKRQPHSMIKHTQRIRRLLLTNFLSVFDYFVGLALKVLKTLAFTNISFASGVNYDLLQALSTDKFLDYEICFTTYLVQIKNKK